MKNEIEVVDVGDPASETILILRHALKLAREGKVVGVVVMLEMPDGGYHTKMNACRNAAERVGRIDFLKDAVKAAAHEEE